MILFYFSTGLRAQLTVGDTVKTEDSGSRGLGSRPDQVDVLCCWAGHLTLSAPIFTQESKANSQESLMKC